MSQSQYCRPNDSGRHRGEKIALTFDEQFAFVLRWPMNWSRNARVVRSVEHTRCIDPQHTQACRDETTTRLVSSVRERADDPLLFLARLPHSPYSLHECVITNEAGLARRFLACSKVIARNYETTRKATAPPQAFSLQTKDRELSISIGAKFTFVRWMKQRRRRSICASWVFLRSGAVSIADLSRLQDRELINVPRKRGFAYPRTHARPPYGQGLLSS